MLSKIPYVFIIVLLETMLFTFCVYAENIEGDSLSSIELGKIIYQKGILPNGEPLIANGKNGLPFKINRTACMDCHRRSGLGTSESGLLIPPITGEYLFKTFEEKGNELLDRVGVPQPIYEENSLKTLIQTGMRPDGRRLNEIMPRYELNNQDSNYLIAYLKSLSQAPTPGLSEDQIEFATIITPGMPETEKAILLTTMTTYMSNINKDVRQLGYMKSPMHGRYKPFRKWNLHVWNLTGEPKSWNSQLDKKYAEQPVFAIIGGYGNWQPIHEFSEQNRVPSLFPITDTPVISKGDFYTLYFSKGIKLDAEAVAQQIIARNKRNPQGNILQIYSDEDSNAVAAKTLKNRLTENEIKNIYELKVNPSYQMTTSKWKEINQKYTPKLLIIWLDKEQSYQILAAIQQDKIQHIYLSSRLMKTYDPELLKNELAEPIKNRISLVHPFYLVNNDKNHLLRSKLWAKSKKINYKSERVFANTYFGLALLTGAIRSSSYNLNREYLMEQYEHMIDNTVYRSIYPHLSLGPDQRFASKGVYLINMSPNSKPEWVIPDF